MEKRTEAYPIRVTISTMVGKDVVKIWSGSLKNLFRKYASKRTATIALICEAALKQRRHSVQRKSLDVSFRVLFYACDKMWLFVFHAQMIQAQGVTLLSLHLAVSGESPRHRKGMKMVRQQ